MERKGRWRKAVFLSERKRVARLLIALLDGGIILRAAQLLALLSPVFCIQNEF